MEDLLGVTATVVSTLVLVAVAIIGFTIRRAIKTQDVDHDRLLEMHQDMVHLKNGQTQAHESRDELRKMLVDHVSDHQVHA